MNAPRMGSLFAALAITASGCSGHITDTSIAPGDLVRVTAPSRVSTSDLYTVLALEADTLVVRGELGTHAADTLALPLSVVKKLELRHGKKSRAGVGALIGLAVGAAVGIAVAGGCAERDEYCGMRYMIYTPVGAASGALLGAFIGSQFRVDRWVEVPPDGLGVGPSWFDADGVQVLVRLRL